MRLKQPQRVMATRSSGLMVRGNTALKAEPMELMAPMPMENIVIPISERVTIMELKESMCRWPHGDPTSQDFRYCGAKKTGSSEGPYCVYHTRMAYQPVQERRRERDRERRMQIQAQMQSSLDG